jgi:DNA polymerase elongation subunit (family B)
MGYRNIFYDIKKSIVHLWTWTEDGERIKTECSFEPYLYIESKDHEDAVSIFNTPLKKLKFNNQFDRARYVKDTPLKRLFYNINVEQQFLLDTFKNEVSKPSFGNFPLKIFYLDIETYATDHFATPQEASDPINLITIYDSLQNRYFTWGCKNYSTLEEDVTYFKCKDERDLLRSFVKFWKNDPPDIVTGWNIHGYDIPYIMNRLSIIFDEDYNKKLSPVERIQLIENAAVNKLGRQIDRWVIKGVSILDYMELYETLCGGKRESMSLNYISEFELGDSKIAIESTSLSTLADTDWFKFVDYNIQDVRLLIKLENKLKYLRLVKNLSYRGFIPFEKSMGKVSMITGAVAHQALNQKLIIPTFNQENIKQKFAGGFVYEPIPGLYENLVTYDANSLYPNTIITLNISPETKIGKILENKNGNLKIRLINGKELNVTQEQFEKVIEKEKLSITKANVLYSQKFKGVIPNLIDKLYNDRVEAKNKMIKAKKLLSKATSEEDKLKLAEQINDNDTLSNVYKTFLNSIYGVFSQIYSPFFDIDHAESITLTGQAVVKQGSQIIYDHAKTSGFEGKIEDVCVYQDTDSEFFSFDDILKLKNVKLLNDKNEITKEAYDIIEEYGDILNKEINDWAKTELKSTDPRYFFKREKICDVALLQAKKYYILHILDKEGVVPKDDEMFEYKGMEVAKAIFSKEVKCLIKNIIESAIMAKERKKATKLFHEAYENYCNLSPEQISNRKKVNNYQKYKDIYDETTSEFGKGTPHHVKSSINFNDALKKLNIDSKYPVIENGTKMKHFYCKKNIYGYETIGFIHHYPKELLNVVKPDYKFMFEKNVIPIISKIFQIIGWPIPAIGCEEYTDLNELFS